MPLIDLPLDELERYRPAIECPDDLAEFWTGTITETRAFPLDLQVRAHPNKLAVIDSFDLTYNGFGGVPVRAWLHTPAGASGPLPTVVCYRGYSGGRGFAHADTIWAQAGYAQLIMDTRGQGWRAGGGSGTADFAPEAGLPHAPGFMTAGIRDPATYYYRRVYADALRLLDVVAELPVTDSGRTAVTGRSQGGGLAIATAGLAALVGIPVLGAAPDVPFLCHFARGVALSDRQPYREIAEYLAGWRDHAAAAYRTLSYVDAANLGRLATAPALFSVALMDPICPPSTVYAAYNHYGTNHDTTVHAPEKSIMVYSHNEHEGGEDYQIDVQLDWFASLFAA